MQKAKKILLASHGTPGARAAEKMAFSLCRSGSILVHLIVVPDFWKGMMGDDWLNNASTRDIYADYVESQLEQEVRKHVRRMMREASKRNIRYRFEVVIGKPVECLIARAKKGRFNLVVMGSKRPKGKTGLRSHMLEEKLFHSLRVPVLIVPDLMGETPGNPAPKSPVDSTDAVWASFPVPFSPDVTQLYCRDVEALFRINPYYYFDTWRKTGADSYYVEFENQSNKTRLVLDLNILQGPGRGLTVAYAGGIKKRTVFTIEPVAEGSRITITDDYDLLPAAEREARKSEVDRSLNAWAESMQVYFLRLKRWSWLPGWRGYLRRFWIPMKPSARRIVWLLYLITVAEFFFFLFVILIYILEQGK